MSEFDKYEKLPNMKDYGLDRPEYILKNGKARNCYGLLIDITELQSELTAKTDIIAELKAENVRLRGEKDELKEKIRLIASHVNSKIIEKPCVFKCEDGSGSFVSVGAINSEMGIIHRCLIDEDYMNHIMERLS